MLSLPPIVRLFVATQAVDGRKGADSLMVLVRDVLQHDPLSGHLFIFFSKRRPRAHRLLGSQRFRDVDETARGRPFLPHLFPPTAGSPSPTWRPRSSR